MRVEPIEPFHQRDMKKACLRWPTTIRSAPSSPARRHISFNRFAGDDMAFGLHATLVEQFQALVENLPEAPVLVLLEGIRHEALGQVEPGHQRRHGQQVDLGVQEIIDVGTLEQRRAPALRTIVGQKYFAVHIPSAR